MRKCGIIFSSLGTPESEIADFRGGFYEKMSPARFWTIHAAIATGGGLLVVLFGRRLSRALHPARRVDELLPNRADGILNRPGSISSHKLARVEDSFNYVAVLV